MRTNQPSGPFPPTTGGRIVLLAFLLQLAFPALPAPGDLDPSFGNSGRVLTDFGSSVELASALVLQPDGKLVAGGDSDGDFALARYNPDGSLDIGFGNGGRVLTDFGGGGIDLALALVLQADGKLVQAGIGGIDANGDFALARYNPNGSLDTSFGDGGRVVTDFGSNRDLARALVLQPDGKLVATGDASAGFVVSGGFFLARYNPDGRLDSSFGNGGRVATDFGHFDVAADLELQPDGKLMVAGAFRSGAGSDFMLVRYTSDGSLDRTFGDGGRVLTDFGGFDGASGLDLQRDGKLVAAGDRSSVGVRDFALVRYNADGSLDASFGNGGRVLTDFGGRDEARALVLQANGTLVAAGDSETGGNRDFALARYRPDGSLDTTFGNGGRVVTDFGDIVDAFALVLQPDGKLVAAGGSNATGSGDADFALARYLGTDVPPAVIEDPEQPGVHPIPPPTPAPGRAKRLVLIFHGWNSDPLQWATAMAAKIRTQLPTDPNVSWDIQAIDWSPEARPLPQTAYANAFAVGKEIGEQLVDRGYDHIHFIAHSAGSNLIDSAIRWLLTIAQDRGIDVPTIHATFLDAYHPDGNVATYGSNTQWAEQYVDKRSEFLLQNTNHVLPFAFNFNITGLDPEDNNLVEVDSFRAHAWPYCWYDAPLVAPVSNDVIEICHRDEPFHISPDYGFKASLESGRGTLLTHNDARFVRGGECNLDVDPECNGTSTKGTPFLEVQTTTEPPFHIWTPGGNVFFTSETGSTDLSTPAVIRLTTSSPAWISVRFDAPGNIINMLRFAYRFPMAAQGLLSVFFDNQLVFRADERLGDTNTLVSEPIPLGNVAPGPHMLSFRLDAFNGTQSSVEISDIRTGTMRVVIRPHCEGKFATIVGTEGPDRLRGTSRADVIAGLGGNDVVDGRGGNDRICGDAGNDRIKGGNGRDRLNGGTGRDRLLGGKGSDTLDGGPGKDTLNGGSGRDKCVRGEKKAGCES